MPNNYFSDSIRKKLGTMNDQDGGSNGMGSMEDKLSNIEMTVNKIFEMFKTMMESNGTEENKNSEIQ